AGHTYGKSSRDVVRALRRDFAHPPDLVAFPQTEEEVTAVLEWCAGANAAVIPYGGGSSVVGGVEPAVGARYAGAVSLDLSGLDRVLEVDRTSRAARIQAGVLGPALEEPLRPHGLTLRHFPQSFAFSPFRASAAVTFADFAAGAAAARALAQAGLYPANCRLLDPGEAATAGAGSGEEAVLLVGFESADHELDAWMARALALAAAHGGRVP